MFTKNVEFIGRFTMNCKFVTKNNNRVYFIYPVKLILKSTLTIKFNNLRLCNPFHLQKMRVIYLLL
ncbi:hypothetical protein VSVS12_01249 [Vibrio scophthalmi]|nr:hypothetical protein VSVS12_01249 [Vibrio scophthalmi]